MEIYEKDPDEIRWLGWTWDVAPHTLETSTWIAPEGLTATDGSYSGTEGTLDDPDAQIKVSGGTLGEVYDLVNRVTTSNGESFDLTIRVVMVKK